MKPIWMCYHVSLVQRGRERDREGVKERVSDPLSLGRKRGRDGERGTGIDINIRDRKIEIDG